MHIRHFAAVATCAALVAVAAVAAPAVASPHFAVAGALRTSAAGPVADGGYTMTFRLYAAAAAVDAAWEEIQVAVPVQHGGFAVEIGAQAKKNPLPEGLFTASDAVWLGVQIEAEPELPRQALGQVPFAWRAQYAVALTGPLAGEQLAAASVPQSALDFSFAGSDQKNGPALALKCTGCIGVAHLDPAVFAPYALAAAVPTLASDNTLAGKNTFQGDATFQGSATFAGGIGVGKAKSPTCALDIGTDGGPLCVDGAPAVVVRFANDAAEMDKVAGEGQIVYRKDTGDAFLHRKGLWRKLLVEAVRGDQTIDVPEQCDDGNEENGDACTTPASSTFAVTASSSLARRPVTTATTTTATPASSARRPSAATASSSRALRPATAATSATRPVSANWGRSGPAR